MDVNDVQRLIDKYGQPAFDAAMRQVWVDLIIDLVWIAALIVAAVFLWRQWDRAKAWVDTLDNFDQDIGTGASFAIARIVPIILMLPLVAVFSNAVAIVLNPQWQAIQILASLLPGK